MSKKTRRSISVAGATYARLFAHAQANGVSLSSLIEDHAEKLLGPAPRIDAAFVERVVARTVSAIVAAAEEVPATKERRPSVDPGRMGTATIARTLALPYDVTLEALRSLRKRELVNLVSPAVWRWRAEPAIESDLGRAEQRVLGCLRAAAEERPLSRTSIPATLPPKPVRFIDARGTVSAGEPTLGKVAAQAQAVGRPAPSRASAARPSAGNSVLF